MLGVRTKAGRIPTSRLSEGTVEHIPSVDGADPTLRLNPHGVSMTYYLVPHQDETSRVVVVGEYYGVFVATDSCLAAPPDDFPDGVTNLITFTAADSRAA